MASSIKVAVRCRPLFDGERAATGLDLQSRRISLDNKTYDPDFTFLPSAQQNDLFQLCKPILESVVENGLNGTIMVYGQTGTGKTYTMIGKDGQEDGIVHKSIVTMLDLAQQKRATGVESALTLSMIEIYNEKLTDMLSTDGREEIQLLAGFPRSATKVIVCKAQDGDKAVARGLAWRRTACTSMNERSSRSHVIIIIDYEEMNPFTNEVEVTHLFLVDLAGSESLKKSHAVGATASEAGKINRSLLALKNVFLALSNTTEATRPSHVPYRDSRLTELLQDSVGGTARTLMIACISSVGRDIEETKSTLLYAVKAKSIRNASNSEREKLLIRLRSLEVENQRLRNRLEDRVVERGGYVVTKEEHERAVQLEEEVTELRSAVEQLTHASDASAAKHHISESYTKSLQDAIDGKEEEVQQMKKVYFQAMQKFDIHAQEIQKAVLRAVDTAKEKADELSAKQYINAEAWRKALEEAADFPVVVPSSSPLCASSSSVSPPLQRCPPLLSPPLHSNSQNDSSEVTSASPLWNAQDGGGNKKEYLDNPQDGCIHDETFASSPLLFARTTQGALQEADAACQQVLQRVHHTLGAVLTALLREKLECSRQIRMVRSERNKKFLLFREDLQERVAAFERATTAADDKIEQAVSTLDREWEASVRAGCAGSIVSTPHPTAIPGTCSIGEGEEEEEEGASVGEDAVTVSLPVPSSALCSLQHVSRNLCHAIGQSTVHIFPSSPDTPQILCDALKAVQSTCEREVTERAIHQLELLSSASLASTSGRTSRFSDASSSSSSSSPSVAGSASSDAWREDKKIDREGARVSSPTCGGVLRCTTTTVERDSGTASSTVSLVPPTLLSKGKFNKPLSTRSSKCALTKNAEGSGPSTTRASFLPTASSSTTSRATARSSARSSSVMALALPSEHCNTVPPMSSLLPSSSSSSDVRDSVVEEEHERGPTSPFATRVSCTSALQREDHPKDERESTVVRTSSSPPSCGPSGTSAVMENMPPTPLMPGEKAENSFTLQDEWQEDRERIGVGPPSSSLLPHSLCLRRSPTPSRSTDVSVTLSAAALPVNVAWTSLLSDGNSERDPHAVGGAHGSGGSERRGLKRTRQGVRSAVRGASSGLSSTGAVRSTHPRRRVEENTSAMVPKVLPKSGYSGRVHKGPSPHLPPSPSRVRPLPRQSQKKRSVSPTRPLWESKSSASLSVLSDRSRSAVSGPDRTLAESELPPTTSSPTIGVRRVPSVPANSSRSTVLEKKNR